MKKRLINFQANPLRWGWATYLRYLKLVRYFEQNDCLITASPKDADTIIFITTGTTGEGEEFLYIWLRALKPYYDKLVVYGLLPALNPGRFSKLYSGKYVTVDNESKIDAFFPEFKIKFNDIREVNFNNELCLLPHLLYNDLNSVPQSGKGYANSYRHKVYKLFRFVLKGSIRPGTFFIRTNNGCFDNCSYCGPRRIIGSLKSKPLSQIQEEFRKGLSLGFRKFMFVSSDVGGYGLDVGSNMAVLLESVLRDAKAKNVQIDLSAIGPRWAVLYKEAIKEFLSMGVIKCLFCSVQSGSDRLLKEMKRFYTAQEVVSVMNDFKSINPQLYTTTEIIIGFPTESESECAASMNLVKEARFDKVLLYSFYPKFNTPAAEIYPRITQEVISRRTADFADFCKKEEIACLCGV